MSVFSFASRKTTAKVQKKIDINKKNALFFKKVTKKFGHIKKKQ